MSVDDAAAGTDTDDSPWLVPLPNGASFRLPDSNNPVEAHLAEANRADRQFSEQQLARLFPTLTPGEPAPAGVWQVEPSRLRRLFSLELLDQLVDHGVDPRRVMLSNWQFLGDVTNASMPETDRIHAAVAGRAVSDGGRVTLTGIERATPGLRRLAEHLGRAWRGRVVTAAAIGAGAFSGQTDLVLAFDHIIVPVQGRRHVVAMMPDGSSLHSGPIGPGEALYLPAGATISTSAVNELFVHLEIRVERPSPRSLLPLVVDLPIAQQVVWDHDSSSLQQTLIARWCAALPARPGTRFSSMIGPYSTGNLATGWVRPTFTGGWCTMTTSDKAERSEDRRLVLLAVAAGTCLQLPEALVSVLAQKLSGPPRRTSDAIAESPAAARLITIMVASGLLEFSPTEPTGYGWDAADAGLVDDRAV